MGIHRVDSQGEQQPWTRPNVTSATSHGTITWGPVGTSGTEDGWHAYDGSASSRYVPKDASSFLKWVLPYNITFYPTSKFVCKGRTDSGEGNENKIYRFYADAEKTIPLTELFSRAGQGETKTIDCTLTESVATDTIYLDTTDSTGYSGFTDINFTGVTTGAPTVYEDVNDVQKSLFGTVEEDWVQPVLTSKTSYGTCTDSRNNTSERQEGWRALDGNPSTHFTPNNNEGEWWQWTVPDTLKFIAGTSTISIVGGEPYTSTWIAYTDSTRTVPLTDTFTCPENGVEVTVPIITTATTSTIYLYKTASSVWSGMASIDFNNVKTVTSTEGFEAKSVYKYRPERSFIQPVLSSDGTLGGNSFAVWASSVETTGYNAYRAFRANPDDGLADWSMAGRPSASNPCYYIMYNPVAICITNLKIQNRNYDNQRFTAVTIQGSNDNSTWTDITSSTNPTSAAKAFWDIPMTDNTNLYKYYRCVFTAGSGYNSGVNSFQITASSPGGYELVFNNTTQGDTE